MPVIFQSFIKRDDLKRNRTVKYLFGDNLVRKGFGGQAKEMRGEPNSIGVATKKLPSLDPNAFFTDLEYEENIRQIELDLQAAFEHVESGGILIIPSDGLGTGLSKLKEMAPKTNQFLESQIDKLKSITEKKFEKINLPKFNAGFPKK